MPLKKNQIIFIVFSLIFILGLGVLFQTFAPDNLKISKTVSNFFPSKTASEVKVGNFLDCQGNGGKIVESIPKKCLFKDNFYLEVTTQNPLQASKDFKYSKFNSDNDFEVLVVKECDLAILLYKKNSPNISFQKNKNLYTIFFNKPLEAKTKTPYYSISCTLDTVTQNNFGVSLNEVNSLNPFSKLFNNAEALNYTDGVLQVKRGKINYQINAFSPNSLENLKRFPIIDIQYNSVAESESSVKLNLQELK